MATALERIEALLSQGQTNDGGMVGAGIGALGTLINGNKAYGGYEDSLNTMRSQLESMPTLDSMYGQNSPYAQQLKQTLARKDAASGRNSQYGPREAQFQAALADKASTYSAQQANTMNTYRQAMAQAQAQQSQIRAQQLASLFNVAQKTGLTDWANKGLQGLFGKGQPGQFDVAQPNYNLGGDGENSYQGWNTSPMDSGNPYSLGSGTSPGFKADSTALMPNWGDTSGNPSFSANDAGTGGFGNGDPYQWY